MKLEKVSIVWLDFCKANKILKILLPLDLVFLFVAGALSLISYFISVGAVVAVLLPFIFWLGILLTLAKCNFKMMSFGIALYAVGNIYNFIVTLFKYRSISYYALLELAIYGLFAFLAYKKSLTVNK